MNIFETPEIEQLRKKYPLNIEYYKLKSIYDLENAPYICLGINPDCKRFKIWFQPIEDEVPIPALQPICRIKEIIEDAIQIKDLSYISTNKGVIKISSIELYNRLNSKLPFPKLLQEHFIKMRDNLDNSNSLKKENAELKHQLRLLKQQHQKKQETAIDKKESHKTMNLLYEIIGAMLSNYCCVNPSSSAEMLPRYITGYIKRLLNDFNISRGDDSIRTHLIKAFEQLTESSNLKDKTHFNKRRYMGSNKDACDKNTAYY